MLVQIRVHRFAWIDARTTRSLAVGMCINVNVVKSLEGVYCEYVGFCYTSGFVDKSTSELSNVHLHMK